MHRRLGKSGSRSRPPPAVTPFIWLVVWVAMSAGWLVGFADGDSPLFIRGFREQFFPQIYTGLGLGNPQDRDITGAAPFCTFVPSHDHDLQLYLALPHLTSPIGALVAAVLSHKRGRKATMWLGCLAFIVAKLLLVTSYSRSQVWAARTVTGVAAGLMHQAPLLEVLEVVPFHRRGALASCQALGNAAGFLCASLLAFGLAVNDSWGWRLVPVFGTWPALLTMLLLLWLPETPSSLLQRGKLTEARIALQRLRGMLQSTEQEFAEILKASQLDSRTRTQLQGLQQWECSVALLVGLGAVTAMCTTGGSILMTSAFPIFYALGYGRVKGYTMSLVLIGFGALLGACAAVALADRLGRKRGVVLGSMLGAACYLAIAVIIKVQYYGNDARQLEHGWAWTVGAMSALACGFSFLSDALLWIFAFEIQPLPTRSLSTGIIVAWKSLQEFAWVLAALHLLCGLRGWGLFLLFAAASVMTAVLAWLFLVHTTNTPLETVGSWWSRHWLYCRCCPSPLPTATSLVSIGSDPGSKPSLAPSVFAASVGSSSRTSEPNLQHQAYLHLVGSGEAGGGGSIGSHGFRELRVLSSAGGSVDSGSLHGAQLMDTMMFQQLSRACPQRPAVVAGTNSVAAGAASASVPVATGGCESAGGRTIAVAADPQHDAGVLAGAAS